MPIEREPPIARAKRDEIRHENGETGGNRVPFSAPEGPPDKRAHDDDLQSRAETVRPSDIALRAAKRRGQHDGERDRTHEHGGVEQGKRRESERDRRPSVSGFSRNRMARAGRIWRVM